MAATLDYDARAVEHSRMRGNGHVEKPVIPLIEIRSGLEIFTNPVPARWLLRPYLESMVTAILYGDLGTYKSFIALDWSLRLASQGIPAVYLSAEGKGLNRRLHAWCLHHHANETPAEVLARIPFFAIERPLELPQTAVLESLESSLDAGAIEPQLIVIDTLSRYAGSLDIDNNRDMGLLIQAADRLRLKYKATNLLVHHTGHSAKDRARGAYNLMASADADFRVERPDITQPLVTVTTGRLKDAESPPPFALRAEIVPLGYEDEDGQPLSSLVLLPTTEQVLAAKREPSSQYVRQSLEALKAAGQPTMTLREIQDVLKPVIADRRRRSDSVVWLQKNGYLTATIGGLRLEV